MPPWSARHRSPTTRPGFTLVEVVVVVLFLGVLAGIALPSYQKIVYRARAARVVSDLHTVLNAAYQYEVENGAWPPDAVRGVIPPAFESYMQGIEFVGDGYLLDWDNWDPVFGIAVLVEDPYLESALLATLQTSEGTFMRMGDRYTYFVDESETP